MTKWRNLAFAAAESIAVAVRQGDGRYTISKTTLPAAPVLIAWIAAS
jgi:hypothetical protein